MIGEGAATESQIERTVQRFVRGIFKNGTVLTGHIWLKSIIGHGQAVLQDRLIRSGGCISAAHTRTLESRPDTQAKAVITVLGPQPCWRLSANSPGARQHALFLGSDNYSRLFAPRRKLETWGSSRTI